jgi:hypothetical protein
MSVACGRGSNQAEGDTGYSGPTHWALTRKGMTAIDRRQFVYDLRGRVIKKPSGRWIGIVGRMQDRRRARRA